MTSIPSNLADLDWFAFDSARLVPVYGEMRNLPPFIIPGSTPVATFGLGPIDAPTAITVRLFLRADVVPS